MRRGSFRARRRASGHRSEWGRGDTRRRECAAFQRLAPSVRTRIEPALPRERAPACHPSHISGAPLARHPCCSADDSTRTVRPIPPPNRCKSARKCARRHRAGHHGANRPEMTSALRPYALFARCKKAQFYREYPGVVGGVGGISPPYGRGGANLGGAGITRHTRGCRPRNRDAGEILARSDISPFPGCRCNYGAARSLW